MMSPTELRNLAWKRLWADHWFGRLFGGGLLLGLCGYAVQIVLNGIFGRLGVQSWMGYLEARAQNRSDLTTPIPNLTPEFMSQATSSTVLTVFFSFIMTGIASYGGAVILKKCLSNDEDDWLREAFGGFRFPFGMLWLQLRYWLIFFVWGLLAALPLIGAVAASAWLVKGFADSNMALALASVTAAMSVGVGVMFAIIGVPFYRYRFLWLVKAEHPEWSAGACIRASRELTDGHKMESFRLDCSYWRPIALVLLLVIPMVVATMSLVAVESPVAKVLAVAVVVVAFLVVTISSVILGQYISVGQGFLYRMLADTGATEQKEEGA